MAIRYYDKALVEKITKWVKDPNMRILKPEEVTRLFQQTADINNDKPISLPLIAIISPDLQYSKAFLAIASQRVQSIKSVSYSPLAFL